MNPSRQKDKKQKKIYDIIIKCGFGCFTSATHKIVMVTTTKMSPCLSDKFFRHRAIIFSPGNHERIANIAILHYCGMLSRVLNQGFYSQINTSFRIFCQMLTFTYKSIQRVFAPCTFWVPNTLLSNSEVHSVNYLNRRSERSAFQYILS